MRCYEPVELAFQGPVPKDSHVWVDLEAIVTGPDGEKAIKGFYAGNGLYKLRFLPEKPGHYTYTIRGILCKHGSVEVDLPLEDHHGIVRADGTAVRHADGTTFHGFGTTVYALAHQTQELMDETIATLAKSPFNKIRMCLFPKHYAYNHNEPAIYPFLVKPGTEMPDFGAIAAADSGTEYLDKSAGVNTVWDVNHPDFRFWDTFEDKLRRLDTLGITVDLILFHPYDRWGFSTMQREDNLTYLEYVLRRFSAFPNLMWSLANEYDLCPAKTQEDWHIFEGKIAAEDPYRHMLSNHNCFGFYDFSRPAITHASLQSRTFSLVDEMMHRYKKPVFYDECCYEGDLQESWGCISSQEMVRRFWRVTVTGGHCTHGETFLPKDGSEVIWWARGGQLIGKSPSRIAYLRNLVENLPGPIEPMQIGIRRMMQITNLPKEQLEAVIDTIPQDIRSFAKVVLAMDRIELTRYLDAETEYGGHVGEDVYLYYMDNSTRSHYGIVLPGNANYTVTVIDTWNMVETVVAQNAHGRYDVPLQGREWFAIIARKK